MQTAQATKTTEDARVPWYKDPVSAYDRWVSEQGVPVHEGFHVQDLKTLPLGHWAARGCDAAFLKLAGQEGVAEVRVSEIAPGQTLLPQKFGFDELVYVVEGRGLTTVQREAGGPETSFEWQTHSLFMLPRHYTHQFSNTQGNRPARLLHYNYLPFVMDAIPDVSFYINSSHVAPDGAVSALYSEATSTETARAGGTGRILWNGNFFPDMLVWDRFTSGDQRGFASHLVAMRYPGSPLTTHMAVFPPFTYKKAHRHGPGVVIIVLSGEGFSFMWPEGQEKKFISWQTGSVFVPPSRWFHQHFNGSEEPVRYLALHSAPSILGYGETVEDLTRDQIEYTDEDPEVRETFQAELSRRGLKSGMPDAVYTDRGFRGGNADKER